MPKWIDAELIKMEDRSETTRSFWLKLSTDKTFEFRPGQFITLDLPISDKRLDRWRSYSIANAPDQSNIIELVIVKVPFGKATTFLFDSKLGDQFKLKGPSGVFCLPKELDPNRELIFICTGTGIAPFRSMIHDLIKENKVLNKIHLIFGTRLASGILYKDEWDQILAEHKNLTVSYALSRESYEGYSGYVHKIYQEKYKNPSPHQFFYLCGWQNMVDEAKNNLLELGFDKTQIIEELYG